MLSSVCVWAKDRLLEIKIDKIEIKKSANREVLFIYKTLVDIACKSLKFLSEKNCNNFFV
jgi:hypothetical protein